MSRLRGWSGLSFWGLETRAGELWAAATRTLAGEQKATAASRGWARKQGRRAGKEEVVRPSRCHASCCPDESVAGVAGSELWAATTRTLAGEQKAVAAFRG
ncbi:hypothetical protein Droror1_Dr00000130 [Drosera rotundifolia]